MRFQYTPSKTQVKAFFKPQGTAVYAASETREVVFSISKDIDSVSKSTLKRKAIKKAIQTNCIQEPAIHNHWEIYKFDIDIKTKPPECAETDFKP